MTAAPSSTGTSAWGVNPGSAGGGEMAGVSPDRRRADTGEAPAQPEGKGTRMAATLGETLQETGTGDRQGQRRGICGSEAPAGQPRRGNGGPW